MQTRKEKYPVFVNLLVVGSPIIRWLGLTHGSTLKDHFWQYSWNAGNQTQVSLM